MFFRSTKKNIEWTDMLNALKQSVFILILKTKVMLKK